MRNITKITLALTLTGTMLGGAAFAAQQKADGEPRKPRAERMFEKWDADKDGKVTAEEVKAFAAERFAKRDIDGDGVVSRDDREKFRTARREERRAERFAKIDADSDGMISLDEFKAYQPERRGMRGEGRGKRGGMHGHRMGGHHGKGMRGERGHRMHGKWGGRHGKGMRRGGMRGPLTIQEAEARAQQRFERIDSDNKGYITLNDVKAFQADRRGNRR